MRESPSALPLPDHQKKDRIRKVGPTTYNKVDRKPDVHRDNSKSLPDNLHYDPKLNEENWRTIPEYGDNYGHPTKYDYNYPTRRFDPTHFAAEVQRFAEMAKEAVPKLPSPGSRQKKLRGQEKAEKAKDYKAHRPIVLRERRKHYREKIKTDPNRDRYQRLYRKYPERFKRTKTSPFGSAAERTKAWREEQKQEAKRRGLSQAELAERRVTAEDWGIWYKHTEPPENPDARSQRVPNLTQRPEKGLHGDPPAASPQGPVHRKIKPVPSAGTGKVIPQWTDLVNHGQPVPEDVPNNYLRNQNGVKTALVWRVARNFVAKVLSNSEEI